MNVNELAQESLANLVQQIDPGAIVTRFVVLIEIVDGEGQRAVWSAVAPDATAWDTLGLLEFGSAREHNGLRVDE